MARLYFGFQTNIEHRNMELNAPQLDTLIFKTKEGLTLSIECDFESDWDLSRDILSGRWKGLAYRVEDTNGNTIVDLADEDNTAKLCNYLDEAKLVAFFIDEDDLMENGYDESFTPECKDIDVRVEIWTPQPNTSSRTNTDNSRLNVFEFHEDRLITEGEYLDTIHEKEYYEEDYTE